MLLVDEMFSDTMQVKDPDGPVVLVDDDDALVMIAERCYEKSSLQGSFLSFRAGLAFLDYMDRVEAGDEPIPSLVLLDINMPVMSGFDILAELRKRERFREVPLICVFSVSDAPRDLEMARRSGANGYKVKPSSPQEFVRFFNSFAA